MSPWLVSAWANLAEGLAAKSSPHAWCIVHPSAVPSNELTDYLIKVLLCHNPTRWTPCGSCVSCRMEAVHPDLLILGPEGSAGMIKIDAVREAIDVAYTTASFGGRRVILVRPADCLNQAASNALLKVVEEPPNRTIFVFQTSVLGRLIPTLVSRLWMVKVPAISIEELRLVGDSITVSSTELDLADNLLAQPMAGQVNPSQFQLAKDVFEALKLVRRGEDSQVIVKKFAKSDTLVVLTVMGRVCEQLILAQFGRVSNPVAQAFLGSPPPITMLYELRERIEDVRRQAQSGISINSGLAFGSLFAAWGFIWSRVQS